MTNLAWVIDRGTLESRFGWRVNVLNDFEAVGYGIPAVDPADIVTLNEGEMHPLGPIAVLGPGTGKHL